MVFADNASTFVDASMVRVVSPKLSLVDTRAINAALIISGQLVDTFVASTGLVGATNNLSTSLERRSGTIQPALSTRSANLVTGLVGNP